MTTNLVKVEEKEVQIKQHGKDVAYIPSQADWNFMVQWGAQAIKTGMLPSAIRSPEAAAIIILKGRELGLSFMTSVAHIHVINGKPSMSAELIQGLARKNLPGLAINILESDTKIATVEFIRPEKGSKPFIQSYTMEEAIKAKLVSKDSWQSYPAAMLWSRCITAGLRKICPEALMGISYTPEELGAEVDQEGNVVDSPSHHQGPARNQAYTSAKAAPIEVVSFVTDNEEKALLVKAITDLMVELKITKEDASEILDKECGIKSLKTATVDQLGKFSALLIKEKDQRSKPLKEYVLTQEKMPWEQDMDKDLK